MHAFRMLLGYVRPHLWAVPVLVVLGFLASAAEGVGIGMLIPLLSLLVQGEQDADTGWFVTAIRGFGAGMDSSARLSLLAGTIFGVVVLKSIVIYAYGAIAVWFNGEIVHALRCALMRQMFQIGYAFFARTEHGRLVNALDREIWRTSEALDRLSHLVIHASSVAVLGVLLLLISWQMTMAVALGVLLVALLIRVAVGRSHRLGTAEVDSHADLSERILEVLRCMRVVRLFGRDQYEQHRFDAASDRARRASLRVGLVTVLIQPLAEVCYVLLFVAILFVWHRDVGLPTLLAFLALLYRLQPHIKGLDHRRVELARLVAAIYEVMALLDANGKPYLRSGKRAYQGLRDAITLRHVGFQYDTAEDRRHALVDVSCIFRKDQATAVVGPSGAGKSTLIALLCRLYDPSQGQIRVDGVPLPEFDLASWRARLAFAGQDLELMGDTIAENIAYSRPDATRDEVVAVAQQADAHEFIMDLPQDYDTRVGERGLRLSAGQRQRIALARALLRKPEILILDEATNALDSQSERAIQDALERLVGKVTMIVIAHRLSTVRLADHVIVLDQGRLVEQGSPGELLRGDSHFSRLWQLQVGAWGEDVII